MQKHMTGVGIKHRALGGRSRPAAAILLPLLLLGILSAPASALLNNNINGTVRIAGASNKGEGDAGRTLIQEYGVYWSKRLVRYLEPRASVRYYDLGFDQGVSGNSWRREYQPSGEILWNHPLVRLTASIQHRASTSNDAISNLVQNGAGIGLSLRSVRYPIVKFRLDWEHTYNSNQRVMRDTRDRLGQLSASYSTRGHSFYYALTRRWLDNIASRLKITDTKHLFRWNQMTTLPGRFLRISSGYSFSHRDEETRKSVDSTVLVTIPYRQALYAHDGTPDIDALDSLPSLGDGNTSAPVQPPVDIGAGLADRNIGLDFGYSRTVAALYIYTDRPSGQAVTWRVYTSEDNLVWTPLPVQTVSMFYTAYSRYEIIFAPVVARYIKAVNSGANDVPSALVTEIEALERLAVTDRRAYHETSHQGNIIGTLRLSKALESTAELTARRQPRGSFSNSRDEVHYAFGARYTPSSRITQSLKYQAGYENYSAGNARNDNSSLLYSLGITPLPTLRFSFGAMNRMEYIQSLKTQETNNASFRTSGAVWPGLTVSGEMTFSRSNRYDARRTFDTRTYRVASDGALISAIDFSASFSYQGTREADRAGLRVRRQYAADFTWRLTTSIVGRGSITLDDDGGRHSTFQEYNLSWNLSPKIQLGALTAFANGASDITSDRSSVQVNYLLGSRASLYAGYSKTDFTSADRAGSTSFQFGLRASL